MSPNQTSYSNLTGPWEVTNSGNGTKIIEDLQKSAPEAYKNGIRLKYSNSSVDPGFYCEPVSLCKLKQISLHRNQGATQPTRSLETHGDVWLTMGQKVNKKWFDLIGSNHEYPENATRLFSSMVSTKQPDVFFTPNDDAILERATDLYKGHSTEPTRLFQVTSHDGQTFSHMDYAVHVTGKLSFGSETMGEASFPCFLVVELNRGSKETKAAKDAQIQESKDDHGSESS